MSAISAAEDLFADPDTPEFGKAMGAALIRSAAHPLSLTTASLTYASSLVKLAPGSVARMLGRKGTPAEGNDRRFADAAWDENPAYFAIRGAYLAACKLGEDVLLAGSGSDVGDAKARLAFQ
ncbi:MAG: hypothetical protein ABIN79_06800, partial [Marmoricola sp.]